MARPKADLDAITVSKGAPEPGSALLPPVTDQSAPKAYAHTLSLRLTAEGYRSLRRYVADEEEKTGRRVTHQSLIEGLLLAFLVEHGRD